MTKNQILETIVNFGRKPVAFEQVPLENETDELTQAVNDPIYHDNNWELRDDIDEQALEKFWDEAAKEQSADSFTE
jgi:hypothetical protein